MGFATYLVRRSIVAFGLVVLVAVINFAIIHLAPGGPSHLLANSPRITPAEREQILASFGLNQPIYQQFYTYITGLFTGNWGLSYFYLEPAYQVIAQRVPATLLLMVPSLIITIIVGISLGILAARKPFSFFDRSLSTFSFFFYAMPAFWLGFILLTLFALDFRFFPASGITSAVGGGSVLDILEHLVLPMTSLVLVNLANFSMVMRTSLVEVLDQNYITTARGKGLTERTIFYRHALRNALLPTVTMTGLYVAFLLTGAIVTETVFTWPGLGLLTYTSIINRDYPVVLSLFFIFAVMIIVVNLLTDVVYGFLDPRISYD
jgi:peptide/nickel transport system permease protein